MIAMQEETKGVCQNQNERSADCGAPEAIRRIEQSVAYMTQHLDRPLQVATLAAHVNISPSHFFALFKRRIGSAPMDYFTRLRMQRASRLLESSSLSVKEIAAQLGYEDPFYFSRVFKSVHGLAPSDFRCARRLGHPSSAQSAELPGFSSEPRTPNQSVSLQFV
jgi:AraC-like DNA-binding protein